MGAQSLGPRCKRIRLSDADEDSTADKSAASSRCRWTELPSDLLREVSRRLHTATNFVRFHAVCKPWRNALPPESCRPALLPWLFTPPDAARRRRSARCIFSPTCRWRVCRVANEPRPGDHAVGTVAGDDTIVRCLFRFEHNNRWRYGWDRYNVSLRLRRPGDSTWTLVETSVTTTLREKGRCSVAYNGGKTVLCHGRGSWCITNNRSWWKAAPVDACERYVSSYVLESRGELLWVVVVQSKSHLALDFHNDVVVDSTVGSRLATELSVSVHALLQEGEPETGEPRWEKRDGRSFADRIMFLGLPTSIAVDAARFDMSNGGCAYFVTKRRILFRYSFRDAMSEFIEQLPGEWDDASCLWMTPQPAFACAAPTEALIKLYKPQVYLSAMQV